MVSFYFDLLNQVNAHGRYPDSTNKVDVHRLYKYGIISYAHSCGVSGPRRIYLTPSALKMFTEIKNEDNGLDYARAGAE